MTLCGFLAGCSNNSDGEETPTPTGNATRDPTETATDSKADLPQPYTSGPGAYLLIAQWIEQAPEDIDPYPSTESPVSDYEVVLTVFDEANEQYERDTPEESPLRDDQSTRGERVTWEVSEEAFYEMEY
jgi:hypothetical protein